MVEQSFFLLGSFPYIEFINKRIFDAYVKLENIQIRNLELNSSILISIMIMIYIIKNKNENNLFFLC